MIVTSELTVCDAQGVPSHIQSMILFSDAVRFRLAKGCYHNILIREFIPSQSLLIERCSTIDWFNIVHEKLNKHIDDNLASFYMNE
jgi:Na+-transporting NADH:ubiquinone oxidoreductase subunit NqrD